MHSHVHLHAHVLCYVISCHLMLCYVMFCYVMMCYVMLCYVMLCSLMSSHITSCYVMRQVYVKNFLLRFLFCSTRLLFLLPFLPILLTSSLPRQSLSLPKHPVLSYLILPYSILSYPVRCHICSNSHPPSIPLSHLYFFFPCH